MKFGPTSSMGPSLSVESSLHVLLQIMDHGAPVLWDDIAGLEFAKATIKEIVVWPMLRP